MDTYVILGAGGFAREVFWHLRDFHKSFRNSSGLQVIFVDDFTPGLTSINIGNKAYPVVKDWIFDQDYPFIIGVGNPKVKQLMVTKALQSGLTPAPTLIHPRALVQDAKVGVGGIITPGCVVTTDVTIGDYVILNLNATVGHDAMIGDYCTVNPGVSISGNTTLGKGVMLGTGSVTREKTFIANGVTVGAGAVVVKNTTEEGITLVGVPASKLVKS